MKIYFLILFTFAVASDKSFGQEFTADSGNRHIMFDSVDIKIIKRAIAILINESDWNRVDDGKCQDDLP